MIPEFPAFKHIEPTDRQAIEKITTLFPSYSDYNFTSMWSWDCGGVVGIAMHEGNLVVRFSDYVTEKPFYSFIGNSNQNRTANALFELSKSEGYEPVLKLIPALTAEGFDSARFFVSEDRDNFDYVLDCELLSEYSGHELRGHASFKRRFIETVGSELSTRVLDVCSLSDQEIMFEMNKKWIENKVAENKDVTPDIELKAIRRFFSICTADKERFASFGVFLGGKLIAYTIDENLGKGWAIRHFMKADNQYKGTYSYLVSESCAHLRSLGVTLLNIEQDLGLSNLRQSKKTYCPVEYLKKFIVAPVNIQGGAV